MVKLKLSNVRVGGRYWHSNLGRCSFTPDCQAKQIADPFHGRIYLKFNDRNLDGDYIRLVNLDLVYE